MELILTNFYLCAEFFIHNERLHLIKYKAKIESSSKNGF